MKYNFKVDISLEMVYMGKIYKKHTVHWNIFTTYVHVLKFEKPNKSIKNIE